MEFRFTWDASKRSYVFEDLRQQADELDLFVRTALDVQVGLQWYGVLNQQLRSNLCKRMKCCDAANETRAIRLLKLHDRIHQAVNDLMARANKCRWNFFLAFRIVILAFFRLEDLKIDSKMYQVSLFGLRISYRFQ